MSRLQKYQQLVEEKVTQYLKVSDVSEEVVKWKPSENEWSILQVHCHVDEWMNFWIEDLLLAINSNEKWGRTLKDDDRLAAVRDVENQDIEEIRSKIVVAKDRVILELGNLDPDVLDIEKEHVVPRIGVKPLSFLIDHFIVEHIDKHINQVERNLKNYKQEVKN
ncbi:DinB family protein [Thalassobacillus sp. CUG 92003]|uniref:DinB family protein n=1 Tax=Thalassobacillus sp. CUG 92003 TaxID=2736641 RepID=UPI0015E7B6B6|nr:DinB family protein [Thalassobacillus sp. CUG 92003]